MVRCVHWSASHALMVAVCAVALSPEQLKETLVPEDGVRGCPWQAYQIQRYAAPSVVLSLMLALKEMV